MRHEDELRRLLRGGPIPAEDEQLAQALRELRTALLSTRPREDVAQDHLTAITAAATEAAHEAPTVAPVGRLHRWGRRVAAAGAVKIATAATVAAAATGSGLAATGNLPQPVQDGIARAAQTVGIDLPDSSERPAPEEQPDDLGTTPAEPAIVDSAPPTSAPPVETPAADTPDEQEPADYPEERPAEERPAEDPVTTDDEAVPFEETPTGEPSETPSDAGSEYRRDPPANGTDAPADASDERSGSADAYSEDEDTPDGTQDDAPDGPGSPD